LIGSKKNAFTELSAKHSPLNKVTYHALASPLSRSRRVPVKLSAVPPSPDLLSYGKGCSARRFPRGLASEISTHDGPGCNVCEDDVGRRLASSPEALLWQEVVNQIIPSTKGAANAVGSFRPN